MTKEKLQEIIDQFDEDKLEKEGIFGISQYGGGADESYIRANKEGLELFALQLLKSLCEMDEPNSNKKKYTIALNIDEDWIDENCDTYIHYIELIDDKQKKEPKREYKSTIIDKLMPFGCGLVLLILVVSVFIGLGTILNWVF